MARKALSETKKAQLRRETLDRLMARAVMLYHAEQAQEIEKAFFQEKGQIVKLNYTTL
ncbi:hypothetical protein C8J56DRAFT_1057885 [Mycena floridula]|nr:hypothetical protein C8J56DRAFT_1057885 [Mycena floridula]